MTMRHYQELVDSMLDEYMSEWHDWDLFIPSFAQAQEQERLLLENKNEGKETMLKVTKIEDLQERISEAFGEPQREIEDRRIYYEEIAEEEAAKKRVENFTLSESQKTLLDEACGIGKAGVNHSLDELFEEAFEDTTRNNSRLQELRESIGSISEGSELLESVLIDSMDSGSNGVFKFSGRAFQVDTVNQNGRRYSREIAEGALRENRGGTLSVISGHPRPGDTDPSKVVGKVVFGRDLDPQGWVLFEAQLSDTSLGLDLQKLLKDKCIGDVSLRSRGKTRQATIDGQVVEEVTSLCFKGLDLVQVGSFSGAKVERIFN